MSTRGQIRHIIEDAYWCGRRSVALPSSAGSIKGVADRNIDRSTDWIMSLEPLRLAEVAEQDAGHGLAVIDRAWILWVDDVPYPSYRKVIELAKEEK